MKKM
jgi:hypothetical protein